VAETDFRSLRFVIQQRGNYPTPNYRIIVYGDAEPQRYSDFSNAQNLIETLRIAIPDFDVSRLALNPWAKGQGSIVFVEEMDLDKHQLTALGLTSTHLSRIELMG
jgi:hypothetical protein